MKEKILEQFSFTDEFKKNGIVSYVPNSLTAEKPGFDHQFLSSLFSMIITVYP